MKGLQATFDQEAKRANNAEAQLEALRTELFEERTTNVARQSLIKAKESQVVTLQGQLAKLQPFLDGLREQLEPTRAIIDGISRHGEGEKRQREEDGGDENSRGEGSSKRLRQ
jgi:chromosome segregation ATPase